LLGSNFKIISRSIFPKPITKETVFVH
jgi:hypothetical protein